MPRNRKKQKGKKKSSNRHGLIPHVSEEPEPLGGFTTDEAPMEWIIRPPPLDGGRYYIFDLCGWRSNLKLALFYLHEARVKQITQTRSESDVREFCEVFMFLEDMAFKGNVKACKLLLDHCSVCVGGNRAGRKSMSDQPYLKLVANGFSPLMIAVSCGRVEVCELLLHYDASLEIKEHAEELTTLHLATLGCNKDAVQLLCKHKANVAHKTRNGCDAIDLIENMQQPHLLAVVDDNKLKEELERIEEVLHRCDKRCTTCKGTPEVFWYCPCLYERYCGRKCQKQRWDQNHETKGVSQ